MDTKISRWCAGCALSLGLAVTAMPALAQSGDLANFINDLYGGDGIFLPQATGIPENIAEAHVPHFTGPEQIAELNALSTGILSGTGIFALNSTVTGITFDLSAGAPVTVEDSLGPLLAERATTIGEGRLSFALGYSSQDYDELDGNSLSDLRVTLIHQDCCAVGPPPIPPPDGARTGFEQDQIIVDVDVTLKQEVFAFFSNYGVSDNWDIGIVVPWVSMDAEAFATASVQLSGAGSLFMGNPVHTFATDPAAAISRTGGSESGLGDVILRTKYNFAKGTEDGVDIALLGQVTLPTGDEDDLLGSGETKYKAMFIASRSMGRVTPHLNVAWEQASSGSQFENLTYALGFDARLTNRFTGGVDVLGRYGRNIDLIGDHIIDLALSAKFNPFNRANAPFTAFVSFPLNDDGLRSDFVWGVGIDITLD